MSGLIYWCLWLLFRVIGRICFRLRFDGQEHIPLKGGLLIAANHASFLDIPLLGSGIPRRVAFLGRQDLFPVPGVREVCRWLGWIPIRPDRLDRAGFRRAIRLIKDGKVVVIYPEGMRTRTGQLSPGKPGLGTIVAATGCPVLPAYISGTYEALPMGSWRLRCHPVRVAFGKPLEFHVEAHRLHRKELYRHISRTVMERIAQLGNVPPPVS